MNNDKVNILGVNVDMLTIKEAAERIYSFLGGDKCRTVFTPNSEIIMMGYRDDEFRDILNSASVLAADGIGVVYASRILKKPLKERCAGFDIAVSLLEKLNGSGYGLFLFGGKPGVAEKAREELLKDYPDLKISGLRNGYFDESDEGDIVKQINESGADIVFVCLGAPKQEKWIYRHRDELKVKAALGIGGSLDVFAKNVERAPEFFCKAGLEWFYRLVKEPSRFKRMTVLPVFGMTVIFKGKRYKKTADR
ncbi:MAG: WecB/TagA/CpsF family glycosyltransferase [Oscillospiraceae bacterium]|nr:WecB/TagA/CpsF family glycosyltransferase [Oscillospiraceae bacterium]